jgi:hypothetical protein
MARMNQSRSGLIALVLGAAVAGCGNDSNGNDADGFRSDTTSSSGASGNSSGSATSASGPGSSSSGGNAAGSGGGATTGSGGSSSGSGGGASPSECGPPLEPGATVYHVAVSGDDGGDGSRSNPWATISHAIEEVEDGAVILVGPGEYFGQVRLDRDFNTPVRIRSEVPYQARLRNSAAVVRVFYGSNIVLEGFDVAHDGPGAGALVVQIQDVDGDGSASYITLRNNVIHDSYSNDILKINNGASHVVVERNLFYNQTGSDEHIDVNSVEDVVIQDNVFMNDFAGSGRSNGNDTSSFIVVKDSNEADDAYVGSKNVRVRRNVFLNYEGSSGTPFLLLGEDGKSYFEVTDVIIENNLMLGNASNPIRAAFGCKGVADVTFRNNTVTGNLPGSAFAMRLNVEGSNPANDGIGFYNNVWSDPTGTMGKFSTTPSGETDSFVLENNLYWNGGQSLPTSGGDLVNVGDDGSATIADPQLGSQAGLAIPRWDQGSSTFGDGSTSICEVRDKLVTLYGTPSAGSAAIDHADAANAPADDILGNPRGGSPDLGAVERP